MEHVEAILYHKILDSDFTNMYEVKEYIGGNGQTYIQAAGFTRNDLERFFQHAKSTTPTVEVWDDLPSHSRCKYVISAQELGSKTVADIEFAPRTGRKDYRIARQNIQNRHPAWTHASGFPQPQIDPKTHKYIRVKNYPNIIDNLYIFIVCTIDNAGNAKYYASYVDSPALPINWPSDVGLDQIFQGQRNRQGILFFDNHYIRFQNDKNNPFLHGSAIDNYINEADLPLDIESTTVDSVEYVTKDFEFSFESSAATFIETAPPSVSKRKDAKRAKATSSLGNDYVQRQKNNKVVGEKGEELVLELERQRLLQLNRPDLAASIEHTSKKHGDGFGYDIISYDLFGDTFQKIFIEVKTTTGGIGKPFEISANEVNASEELDDHYYIYRLFGLHKNSTNITYYRISGSLRKKFDLIPSSYLAIPK